jgi:DHA1 family multidrug resistance protein-like MFS transporter
MFMGSFAWSFVFVSLPFYIQQLSTLDAASTLRWTGWILGISPLATVLSAPLWGRLASRGDPRLHYVLVEVSQGVGFLGMALARTLPEMLLARLVLGVTGAASTFAFIIAGRSPDPRQVQRQVAAIQSAMTVGQVLGPLAGALAASRLGFRGSFILGGVILVSCAGLVWRGLPPTPAREAARSAGPPARPREVLSVALIVLGGSTQVFFLTAVLPQVLPTLGVAAGDTLALGGILIFISGAAAALGAMLTPRLVELLPARRLIPGLLVAASVLCLLLATAGSVALYGTLRFLQVLCLAPVFPIVVSRIAQRAGGEAIGLINSARIGAAFVGPVLATSILAWTSPLALYLALALIGLACAPLLGRRGVAPRRP